MDLPIRSFRDAICDLILDNRVCIISGPPGCGKTTQIPQYLLSRSPSLKIGVTQPRRLAALSVARRVASELRTRIGDEVAYSIRFEDTSTSRTRIKYMTDGVLLREALTDPSISRYDVLIIDEAHERSLNTDLLLGIARQVTRPDFHLVITSATIDIQVFANYFDGCPYLEITGQAFPVDIMHSPAKPDRRVEFAVNAVLRIHLHEGPGDILVFLTGAEECEEACTLCFEKLQSLLSKGKPVPSMLILSLYGAMSSTDQRKVFSPPPEETRKVVFSTNIAESSVTLNGIVFVVDCGYVKQKQFNPRLGLDALVAVPASKEQSTQRAGRAGRTAPGKCFRMFSEDFFQQYMPQAAVPEIKRVNLVSTLLTLKALGIKDVLSFQFIDKPEYESTLLALKQLYLIGGIDIDGNLTEIGRQLAKIPVEPSYARCVLSATAIGCLEDMLSLVAMVSSEHSVKNLSFADSSGDHMVYVYMYDAWIRARDRHQWCGEVDINPRTMMQAHEIRRQLKKICKKLTVPELPETKTLAAAKELKRSEKIRLGLCAGFFMNTGRAVDYGTPGSYLSVDNCSLMHLDRECVFSHANKFPKWILYTTQAGNSLVQGTLKDVSKIQSDWVQSLVPMLENVNLERLAGTAKIKEKKIESVSQDKKDEQKVESAKQRYLARKYGTS